MAASKANPLTWSPVGDQKRLLRFRFVLVAGILAAIPSVGFGQSLQDFFTNRETVTNVSGILLGSNNLATVETGEPQHGGKPGGHSLWISWVAPANGIATFQTDGSTFDTLLSAYYFSSTNDTTLDKLQKAAQNDDASGIAPASLIQFGAQAGQRYEIAVDGYYGAVGSVVLRWDFINATSPPPIIVSVPNDQAAKQGDPISLTVNIQTSPNINFEWNFNEEELPVESTNLFIPSLQTTNLGFYRLRISIGSVRFFTSPVEIQINSEGDTNALARDKLLDSGSSAIIGDDGNGPVANPGEAYHKLGGGTIGVVRGYTGSQVFNTTFATNDPAEPAHCGIPGGSSYWLTYQPPTNGVLSLDTMGSSYDTVMEVYTYNSPPTNYSDLISLACDHNSGGATNGASRVSLPVVKTRQYLIVVDGVNGARGTAWLNYKLATNQPASAPSLMAATSRRVALPGTDVFLTLTVGGAPPLMYSWKKNQTPLPVNIPSLVLSNVTLGDSANYVVTVTNDLGSLTAVLPLRVIFAPACQLSHTTNGLSLSWGTVTGLTYTVEEATSLLGPWQAWTQSVSGSGSTVSVDVPLSDSRFYRIHIE